MNKKLGTIALLAGVVGALVVTPAAHAESCTDLPGSTTGATLEAGGQEIRVPAVRGLELCTEGSGGLGGLPAISTDPSGNCWDLCYSVILTGSSGGGDGYVALRFYTDDQQRQVSVPIPGGGPSTERCLVGVGAPEARADCEVKLSLDDAPVPLCNRNLPFCVPPGEGEIEGTVWWVLAMFCINPDDPMTTCA